jgi:hypothetical protein
VSTVNARRIKRYALRQLGLQTYLRDPGDGRVKPQIAAAAMIWALLICQILRRSSYHGVEELVRSRARRNLAVSDSFGDDTLAYLTERLDAGKLRGALAQALRRSKRNKAFENSRWIGLAVDGTGAGRVNATEAGCELCHPLVGGDKEVIGHLHHFSMISVVGTGLSLPLDVEPWGRADCEYEASQRLLRRTVDAVGRRFADYVAGDSLYATAPFLNTATELGLYAVCRLKENVPTLLGDAQRYFAERPPTTTFWHERDFVEVWDAEGFPPWGTLKWQRVRVMRYRQHKPDGKVVEAYWLTSFPKRLCGSQALFHMAKARWEIENQGFNDGKTRHGMEHIRHHEPNSLLIDWLLIALALTIERLFRIRYLHRGNSTTMSAQALVTALWLALGSARHRPRPQPCAADTS